MTARGPGPPGQPQRRQYPSPAAWLCRGHHPRDGSPPTLKPRGIPQAPPPSSRATPSHHRTQDGDHQVPAAPGWLPTPCARARVVPSNPAGVLGTPCSQQRGCTEHGQCCSPPSSTVRAAPHPCGREKAASAAPLVPLHPLASETERAGTTDPQLWCASPGIRLSRRSHPRVG